MLIGLLGGTFDPVHNGHLHVAKCVLNQLSLDEIRLLPCYLPVHRPEPKASPEDRLAMTKLACDKLVKITVDEHEIMRGGPSYMIDTLRDLKKENPQHHYCLILGKDAFDRFHQWHEWEHILDYCHLIIVSRPSTATEYPDSLKSLIKKHSTNLISELSKHSCGKILFCSIPPLEISATQLRSQLAQKNYDVSIIPAPVCLYIQQHGLYLASSS